MMSRDSREMVDVRIMFDGDNYVVVDRERNVLDWRKANMKVDCYNEECVHHQADDTCARDEIIINEDGRCASVKEDD